VALGTPGGLYGWQVRGQQFSLSPCNSDISNIIYIESGATAVQIFFSTCEQGDCGDGTVDAWLLDSSGALITPIGTACSSVGLDGVLQTIDPLPSTCAAIGFQIASDCSHYGNSCSATGTLQWFGAPPQCPECLYGHAPIQPNATIIEVTPALIGEVAEVLGFAGAPWLVILAGITAIAIQSLCAVEPPCCHLPTNSDWVTINPNTGVSYAFEKLVICFFAVVWQLVCQCNVAPPGSPPQPPLPAPGPNPLPPPIVVPPGPPTPGPLPVPITCNNGDLCAVLNQIRTDILGVGQTLAQITSAMTGLLQNLTSQTATLSTLVTLIQRQAAPFGYINGTSHAGLTGTGSIAVSDILGLSVSFTGGSGVIGREIGHPDTLFDAGWLNVGDASGFRSRERIRTNPWVWFPPAAGEITVVGYTLAPLVTATITELIREP
jgi:hypothetical protein